MTIAAECIHGLTVDWCSICKINGIDRPQARRRATFELTGPDSVTMPDGKRLPVFTAKFPGRCNECEDDIEEGDPIVKNGSGWAHEECV